MNYYDHSIERKGDIKIDSSIHFNTSWLKTSDVGDLVSGLENIIENSAYVTGVLWVPSEEYSGNKAGIWIYQWTFLFHRSEKSSIIYFWKLLRNHINQ